MTDTTLETAGAFAAPGHQAYEDDAGVGPYRLVSRLGRGGMGVVHHAVHRITGRVVALKVLELDGHHLKHHLERVTQEAMAMAALRHPHIVTCYSFGEDGRRLYLALELVRGGDTTQLVARCGGRLDEAMIRTLAAACGSGLAAIHRAGLVHRDIKPSNILLDEHGQAKLADFGLAFFHKGEPGPTGTKAEVGTPSYMPPEAVTGEVIPDIRGDIYSLGVTMYYWATGASPFKDSNGYTTMQRVLNAQVPDLRTLRPDLSGELCAIIATAMQRDRTRRFSDPEAFLAALRGEPSAPDAGDPRPFPPASTVAAAAPQRSAPPARGPWSRSAWAALGVGAMTAMLLLALRPGAASAQRMELPAPAAGAGAPAIQALADGYRLSWLGDPMLHFTENGAVTYTRSGQRLHLADEAWLDGTAAPALTSQLGATNDFSIELALRPANLVQEGPARIFSIGLTQRAADLMIGQSGSRLEVRVRTTATNPDGTRPHLVSEDGVLDGRWQHLVFVRAGTHHRLYVDGGLRAEVEVPGDLGAWDPSYPLCVGNDHRGGFPWSGSLERLVLARGAWSAGDIATRYRAWVASGTESAPAR